MTHRKHQKHAKTHKQPKTGLFTESVKSWKMVDTGKWSFRVQVISLRNHSLTKESRKHQKDQNFNNNDRNVCF